MSKSKTLKHTLKCAWCGQLVTLLPSQRPKQHRNGAQLCPGSSQLKAVHDNLVKLNEEARKERK